MDPTGYYSDRCVAESRDMDVPFLRATWRELARRWFLVFIFKPLIYGQGISGSHKGPKLRLSCVESQVWSGVVSVAMVRYMNKNKEKFSLKGAYTRLIFTSPSGFILAITTHAPPRTNPRRTRQPTGLQRLFNKKIAYFPKAVDYIIEVEMWLGGTLESSVRH